MLLQHQHDEAPETIHLTTFMARNLVMKISSNMSFMKIRQNIENIGIDLINFVLWSSVGPQNLISRIDVSWTRGLSTTGFLRNVHIPVFLSGHVSQKGFRKAKAI